jgi:hypothetical protein
LLPQIVGVEPSSTQFLDARTIRLAVYRLLAVGANGQVAERVNVRQRAIRGPKIVNSVSYVGSVAFEEAGKALHGISGGVGSRGKRSRNASPLGAVPACTVRVPVPSKFQAA